MGIILGEFQNMTLHLPAIIPSPNKIGGGVKRKDA